MSSCDHAVLGLLAAEGGYEEVGSGMLVNGHWSTVASIAEMSHSDTTALQAPGRQRAGTVSYLPSDTTVASSAGCGLQAPLAAPQLEHRAHITHITV